MRSTTWEPPSPATLTWLVVKLFTFRVTWAFCRAVAAVVLPVAMPWIWLTRAWACALLAGTVFPETMRADAAYIGGCFATIQRDSDEGRGYAQKHQRPVLPQQARGYLVYFHRTSSTALARVASRSMTRLESSPLGTNRSLT